jgi:hypothetical protein
MDRSWIFKGQVTRVVDADTYDIRLSLGFNISQEIRFRLVGADRDYDAPETWRPKYISERQHGESATAHAKKLVENKDVTIKSVRKGKYRYVAVIYFTDDAGNHVDLAEYLISCGYQKLDEAEYKQLDEGLNHEQS